MTTPSTAALRIPVALELLVDDMRLGRGQNTHHKGWQGTAAQVKRERAQLNWALSRKWIGIMPGDVGPFRAAAGPGPWSVTLTRVAPSAGLDAHDNLSASFKAIVDELARWLGVDDRNPRVRWQYAQERGPWAVRIRIEEVA